MSAANTKAKLPKQMVGIRIEPTLHAALESAAQMSGRTVSEEIVASLQRSYLDAGPTNDVRIAHIEQLLARLDGRHRADARATKEMLGSLVYLLLLYNPELPEDNKKPAHASALRRLEKFIRSVTRNLKDGHSLLTIDEREPVPEGLRSGEVSKENNQ
jgi:hypothetical protein